MAIYPRIKSVFWILFFLFPLMAVAQKPANDACTSASDVQMGSGNFGRGTFLSDSFAMDSATVQTGEYFHSSIVTAGIDKKSVWFKFYLPARRGISIELKQNGNKIAIKDCGFTTYLSSSCLPGSAAAVAAKLATLDQFGSSFHPCMEPGWYMVQVSSKAAVKEKIFIAITTTYPYEHSVITNAVYDLQKNAYQFGDDVVGRYGYQTEYTDFTLGCYTVNNAQELYKDLGANYAAYSQSAWFTFKARGRSDFAQIGYYAYSPYFGSGDTIAFRLFKGNCRDSSISLQLLDSSFSNFATSNTCGGTASYPVTKPYRCYFDSGVTYSIQLLFHKNATNVVRVTVEDATSEYDAGYTKPLLSKSKNIGTISGTVYQNYGFSCKSKIAANVCGNSTPAAGIKQYFHRYNLNNWFYFTLVNTSKLEISLAGSTNGNTGNYLTDLGFRLYKDTITNSCTDVDTSRIIGVGNGYTTYTFNCLEPGTYAIQLLGVDSIATNGYTKCWGSYHLGRDYRLIATATKIPAKSRFSLNKKGEADTINVVAGVMKPLPNFTTVNSKPDTIACNNAPQPEKLFSSYKKSVYRVFKIGDINADGVGDSGMVEIVTPSIFGYTARLYKGNALTLRDSQNVSTWPDTLKGLKPYATPFYPNYGTRQTVCITPGDYTFVDYVNDAKIGTVDKSSFSFYSGKTKYDKYSKAELVNANVKYGTYTSAADMFTCLFNPDTIDGIYCSKKNTYHVFHLDSVANTRIYIPYPYYQSSSANYLSLFKGDIRNGKSGLKVVKDASGNWSCQPLWTGAGRTTPPCEPLMPGWYTVMLSNTSTMGYDSANRQGGSGQEYLYTASKWFQIVTAKPTIQLPKYNKPYKAAFVDSLVNGKKPLGFSKDYSSVKGMPQHLEKFQFPEEYLECRLDTPITAFQSSKLCNLNVTGVIYYVFTLKQNSYVRINSGNSGISYYKTKLFDFDVRKDSSKLNTVKPIQDCNYNPQYLDFCNLQAGVYTLVYLVSRAPSQTFRIKPVVLIDTVASSRFDHANGAYDFGAIPGDGSYYYGKKGDKHPVDSTLYPSADRITCRTGAQPQDPWNVTLCYSQYNPFVYRGGGTNVSMFPYDSSYTKHRGQNYTINGAAPRRNLWYTFVINGTGKATVALWGLDQKYLYPTAYNLRMAVYESDENGALTFDSLRKLGKVDSTLAQGLKLLGYTTSPNCGAITSNGITFDKSSCGDKPRRYYVLVDINNIQEDVNASINYNTYVYIKYDSVHYPKAKFDYYSTANKINEFTSTELLQNGDKSTYLTTGWTANSGSWNKVSGALYPYSGDYFFSPQSSAGTAQISQVADISKYASYISAGKTTAVLKWSEITAKETTQDQTQIVLEFLNASNAVVQTYSSGFISTDGAWKHKTYSVTTPSNAVKARVRLESKNNSGGTNDAYFRDVSLIVYVTDTTALTGMISGKFYSGEATYLKGSTYDKTDDGKTYGTSCPNSPGSVWYKFKIDKAGYFYFNLWRYHSNGGHYTQRSLYTSDAYIRLFRSETPGDSVNGLQRVMHTGNATLSDQQYYNSTCVTPGIYYIQISGCHPSGPSFGLDCQDLVFPVVHFTEQNGDLCKTAIPLSLDTIGSTTGTALVNCHTIGSDFGEDGSNMGCLYGPSGYKSTWYKLDYTDTAKVDLEFSLSNGTNTNANNIRYRTFYGGCDALTAAPCVNNGLTKFTLNCIRNGSYFVQVVTPEATTGNLTLKTETKVNKDTTCKPVNNFKPRASFTYKPSCPDNFIGFINTSSIGDSIRYYWTFKTINQTSQDFNPVVAYPSLAKDKNYYVKLVVENYARGVRDSVENQITVPFGTSVKVLSNDTAICEGDSVKITARLNLGKGHWNTGDTAKSIFVKTTGWYTYQLKQEPNLLKDGSAESGSVTTGWKVKAGNWVVNSHSIVPDGYQVFLPSGTASYAELEQIVTLTSDTAQIDSGLAKTYFSGYMKTEVETLQDETQIEVKYLDRNNNVLASYSSGFMAGSDYWRHISQTRTTPPQTRKIVITLQVNNGGTGTNLRAYFDHFILKMRSPCDHMDSVYVKVNPLPETALGRDTSICFGDSVSFAPQFIKYTNRYKLQDNLAAPGFKGSLKGSAFHNGPRQAVQLNTSHETYDWGNIEWVDSTLKINQKFEIGFDLWSGWNGLGCQGDAVYLYLFNTGSPTYEYDSKAGYSIVLSEVNNDRVEINWNGSRLTNINNSERFDIGRWQRVRVLYDNKKITVILNGKIIASYTDPTSRTQTGYRMGIGATTSYCVNDHFVRNYYVTTSNPHLVVMPNPLQNKFTYQWSDGNIDSLRWIKKTGSYILRVADINACKSRPDTVNVQVRKTYDSLLGGPQTVCALLDTLRLSPLVKGGKYYGHGAVDSAGLIKVPLSSFGTNTYFYTISDTFKCKYRDTGTFVVDSVPDIQITTVGPLCKNSNPIRLQVNNSDGYFYGGNYVDSFGNFYPNKTTTRANKVYYATHGTYCVGLDSQTVYVDSVPNASLSAAGPFCKNAGLKTLTAAKNSGGSFSGGTFVSTSGVFNPDIAGVGTHKIYYTFTDNNSCNNRDSLNVRVDSIPSAAITAAGPFCKNAGLKTMTAAKNSGGTFSGGSFISSTGNFDPNTAGVGTHKIYYSFTDSRSCANKDSALVRVDSIPNAAILPAGPFCKNAGLKALAAAKNIGGVFSGGSFVSSSGSFNPNTAGVGTHKVYYTYTDSRSCANKDSALVKVDSLPSAAITAAGPFCKNAGLKTLTAAKNTGGTFSGGSFVTTGGIFDPNAAGVGTHKIYYTFTDNNSCNNRDSLNVRVDSIPSAAITAAGPFCKNAGLKTISAVKNSGGIFSGGSFISSSGNFDPNTAGVGAHKIYYSFTDSRSCANKDSALVRVDSIPNAAIVPAGPFCKNAGLKALAAAKNIGGIFSGGTFVSSSGSFNPNTAGVGTHKVYYTFTDSRSCANKDSALVKVDSLPSAAITAAGPFCKNAGLKTLTAAKNTGGTFSGGTFVSTSGVFNPNIAGVGTHKIYYTFTDNNSCSNRDSLNVRVDSIPSAAITAAGPFCKNAGLKTMTAAKNSGGTFSGGSFISSTGNFDPNTAGVGTHKIYYSFTDSRSCANKDSALVRVDSIPNAAILPAGPFCKNAGLKALAAAKNIGGVFSGGSFVSSSGSFNPNTAGVGTHKVYYTYTDSRSCANKDSAFVKVDSLPSAAITAAGPFCKNAGLKTLTAAKNTGGTFSGGSFVTTGGIFDPNTAGVGTHKIYYTFTDNNSCNNRDSLNIQVDSIPSAAITAAGPFCKNAGLKTMTAAKNSGGIFSGGSFISSSGNFDPNTAGVSTHKIYYSFTDSRSCANKDSALVRVDSIPNAAIVPAGPFCKNAGLKALAAAKNIGGVFSGGTFVSSSGSFNPNTAGVGTHKVYYTFTDSRSCANKDSAFVKVDSLPSAAITAAGPLCKNAGLKTLTAAKNTGGTFSGGSFVTTGGIFDPNTAGVGTHKIYYTFTDNNSCNNRDSLNIQVDSIPSAAITAAGPFCKNAGLKTMTAAKNSGGTFSGGSFISSSGNFDPNTAGVGTHKIYYSFTDSRSCANKDSTLVKVDSVPSAAIVPEGPFCKNEPYVVLQALHTGGGNFYGLDVDAQGWFHPQLAQPGTHTVYYAVADNTTGCSNLDSAKITIFALPDAGIVPAGPFCANAGLQTISAKTSGGTFTSNNYLSSNGSFDPSKASLGNNKIYYSVTDLNNCGNFDSISIVVFGAPQNTLLVNPVKGCEPLNITYSTQSEDSIRWTIGNEVHTDKTLVNSTLSQGNYTLALEVINAAGCRIFLDTLIDVFPNPTADFDFNPTTVYASDAQVYFNDLSSGGVTNWKWYFGDNDSSTLSDPFHLYKSGGSYDIQLFVMDNNGCKDSASERINILDNMLFFIPTAITPDNNGINDVFSISGQGFTKVTCSIFNRWGEKIYESDNFKSWDAMYRGQPVPDGVYVYHLVFTDYDGYKHQRKGDITILK